MNARAKRFFGWFGAYVAIILIFLFVSLIGALLAMLGWYWIVLAVLLFIGVIAWCASKEE